MTAVTYRKGLTFNFSSLQPAQEAASQSKVNHQHYRYVWALNHSPYSSYTLLHLYEPRQSHKLMGFYMEVSIAGVVLQYMDSFCFFKVFLIGPVHAWCIGLECKYRSAKEETILQLAIQLYSSCVDGHTVLHV